MAEDYDANGLIRLGEEECWRFLAERSLGRLAVVHLENPLIFPVNYALDGRSVVFRTAPGTKLAMAAIGPLVVFEVDEADELFETGTSVMVHGTMREVTDRDERSRLARLPVRAWAPGDRDHVVRVEPTWVSGRRIPLRSVNDGVSADAG
jgi:nitroimidazol reductase NimA-like FMN-containing flavoprotein (pyridoxamine 5'-phosphate oxidase superfamily)